MADSKHANKRKPADIARDRVFIERLYLWGYNQLDITRMVNERVRADYDASIREREAQLRAAADAGDLPLFAKLEAAEPPRSYTLSRTQIQFDIEAIKQEWRKEGDFDAVEVLNRELRRLDFMEHEYLLAWERSKRNRVVATKTDHDLTRGKGGDSADDDTPAGALVTRSRKVSRVEYRDGNPAFMQGAERVAADRRKLLGLYSGAMGDGGPDGAHGARGMGDEPTKLYAGFDIGKLERGGKPAKVEVTAGVSDG